MDNGWTDMAEYTRDLNFEHEIERDGFFLARGEKPWSNGSTFSCYRKIRVNRWSDKIWQTREK